MKLLKIEDNDIYAVYFSQTISHFLCLLGCLSLFTNSSLSIIGFELSFANFELHFFSCMPRSRRIFAACFIWTNVKIRCLKFWQVAELILLLQLLRFKPRL